MMAYVDDFRSGLWSPPRAGISIGSDSTTSGWSAPRMDTALLARLVELGQLYFEDYSKELSAGTTEACLVLCSLPWVAPPMLSADSDGSIVATWERDGSCLTIKFVNRYVLHYAMTSTSPEGQVQRDWGQGYVAFFLSDNRTAAKIARR